LLLALKVLSEGDTLVVTRLDRLGRSLRDLANIAHEIEAKGAALRVLEQSVDTSTSAGKAFFGMLAVFAQFETDVRRERQAEGIGRIIADPILRRQKYPGGKPRINRGKVLSMWKDTGRRRSPRLSASAECRSTVSCRPAPKRDEPYTRTLLNWL
jgi:DNA invertase Pin-like site-specific DNA recombinase